MKRDEIRIPKMENFGRFNMPGVLHCVQLSVNIDEKEVLPGILPEGYSYHYIEIELNVQLGKAHALHF